MPSAPPRLCKCGAIIPHGQRCPRCFRPRQRTDATDREYGKQAWRKLALSVIERDHGICHLCGGLGADTAHHLVEKRDGGTDDPRNLRAVHRGCHNRAHNRQG